MRITPVYDTAKQMPPALEELREVRRYSHLLFQLVRRDILTRYKRSVLGVAWTMLNPLGMMIVLTIVFSQLFATTIRAYPVYILASLVGWNFFAQSTSAAMSSLVWGGGLLQRIYIPRTTFALSAIGTGLVNLFLSLVPLMVVMLASNVALHPVILFLPVPILLLAAFALGVGLILSTLAIYFPDVAEMYQIVITAWMYLTPIIYPEEILPAQFRSLLYINPMYYLVRLFRLPVYDGRLPSWAEFWPGLAWAGGVLLLGWLFFTYKSDEFAYRV